MARTPRTKEWILPEIIIVVSFIFLVWLFEFKEYNLILTGVFFFLTINGALKALVKGGAKNIIDALSVRYSTALFTSGFVLFFAFVAITSGDWNPLYDSSNAHANLKKLIYVHHWVWSSPWLIWLLKIFRSLDSPSLMAKNIILAKQIAIIVTAFLVVLIIFNDAIGANRPVFILVSGTAIVSWLLFFLISENDITKNDFLKNFLCLALGITLGIWTEGIMMLVIEYWLPLGATQIE